ncbi:hypothetical protein J6590_070366 [Homalodisca vitripennis]|nr:hypothetical protein J6590_070366 [Homalodisca vitripennis]
MKDHWFLRTNRNQRSDLVLDCVIRYVLKHCFTTRSHYSRARMGRGRLQNSPDVSPKWILPIKRPMPTPEEANTPGMYSPYLYDGCTLTRLHIIFFAQGNHVAVRSNKVGVQNRPLKTQGWIRDSNPKECRKPFEDRSSSEGGDKIRIAKKCSKEFFNPTEMAKCVECKAEYHPGCCRIRIEPKLKGLITSGAGWKCEDCYQDSSSIGSKSDIEDSSLLNILKSIQRQMKQDKDEKNKFRKEYEELKSKNATLVRRVNELEDSVIEQEQYSRVTNLEKRGVKQREKEDVYAVLKSVAKALKLIFDQRDTSIAHRLPAPKDRRFHPAIVAQFAWRSVRGEWLAASKKTRFQTTDLHETFSSGPVFVNEHLSLHSKDLLCALQLSLSNLFSLR